jgi:hypothetical protein
MIMLLSIVAGADSRTCLVTLRQESAGVCSVYGSKLLPNRPCGVNNRLIELVISFLQSSFAKSKKQALE